MKSNRRDCKRGTILGSEKCKNRRGRSVSAASSEGMVD